MSEEDIKDEAFYKLPMNPTNIFKDYLAKGLIKSKRENNLMKIKRNLIG